MATDITFSTVTNATTVGTGTGYFDVLMNTINLHVEDQYNKNRLTGTDYATVYLGLVQSALAQSQQFTLQEKLQEAQIDGVAADNLLKAKQLEIAQKELDIKAYELLNLLPKQLEKMDEEIDLLQTQDSELLLNGIKDRVLKDEQVLKIQEEVDLLQTQDSELLLNGIKDRALKDEQVLKIQEEVDLLQSQDSELLLNGAKDRLVKDEQIQQLKLEQIIKDKEAAKLGLDDVMKIAEGARNGSTVYTLKYI